MIYIRADSNPEIASGHVMRCLAIAQAFQDMGQKVIFLTADDYPSKILKQANFQNIVLNSVWNDLSQEVEKVKDILSQNKNSLLFIDTYQVTRSYVESLMPYAKICYLGSKREYLGNINAVINYSTKIDYEFYSNNYDASKTKLLLGYSYAPLRKEFQNISLHFREKVQQIFLSTGNTDPYNLLEKLISLLLSTKETKNINLNVIVGSMFKNRDKLYLQYENINNIHLYENVQDMGSLMQNMDLAISANGTTVWELAAAGVPVISFAMVKEQEPNAVQMGKLGLVNYCGNTYQNESECMTKILDKTKMYCSDYEARKNLVYQARKVIDGKGSLRIASQIGKLLDGSGDIFEH